MTCYVSGGTLKPTHSSTKLLTADGWLELGKMFRCSTTLSGSAFQILAAVATEKAWLQIVDSLKGGSAMKNTINKITQNIFPTHQSQLQWADSWRWFQLPLGKKWQVLCSSVPCDQDYLRTGWSRLKALAVNVSQPSSQHRLYASLIGSNPRQLKAP